MSEMLKPKEIQSILGLSKDKTYELLGSGAFHVVRLGRMILVDREVFDAWRKGKNV